MRVESIWVMLFLWNNNCESWNCFLKENRTYFGQVCPKSVFGVSGTILDTIWTILDQLWTKIANNKIYKQKSIKNPSLYIYPSLLSTYLSCVGHVLDQMYPTCVEHVLSQTSTRLRGATGGQRVPNGVNREALKRISWASM